MYYYNYTYHVVIRSAISPFGHYFCEVHTFLVYYQMTRNTEGPRQQAQSIHISSACGLAPISSGIPVYFGATTKGRQSFASETNPLVDCYGGFTVRVKPTWSRISICLVTSLPPPHSLSIRLWVCLWAYLMFHFPFFLSVLLFVIAVSSLIFFLSV